MVFKSTKKDDKKRDDTYIISTAVEVEDDVHVPMSYIGEAMKIKADITSDENVTIEGNVTGKINISKTLIIGKKGSVKANVKAVVVRIFGESKGNITASEKVEILAQGRHTGDIQSQILVVEEGAILNGNVNQKKGREKK